MVAVLPDLVTRTDLPENLSPPLVLRLVSSTQEFFALLCWELSRMAWEKQLWLRHSGEALALILVFVLFSGKGGKWVVGISSTFSFKNWFVLWLLSDSSEQQRQSLLLGCLHIFTFWEREVFLRANPNCWMDRQWTFSLTKSALGDFWLVYQS